jgi:hypothetical protein
VIAALGFSINVLTLLAFVLAIGLVVDDAIVMLENIYRNVELGQSPIYAAVFGAKEVTFAVIATTLTLAAVMVRDLSVPLGNVGVVALPSHLPLTRPVGCVVVARGHQRWPKHEPRDHQWDQQEIRSLPNCSQGEEYGDAQSGYPLTRGRCRTRGHYRRRFVQQWLAIEQR